MVPEPPQVYVLDDDRGVRTSLVTLLNAEGIQARPFAGGQDLLEDLAPGVLLIDVRLVYRDAALASFTGRIDIDGEAAAESDLTVYEPPTPQERTA